VSSSEVVAKDSAAEAELWSSESGGIPRRRDGKPKCMVSRRGQVTARGMSHKIVTELANRLVTPPSLHTISADDESSSWKWELRWPWKSESAKECVKIYLPNELVLKMDGAQACYPYLAAGVD
jgi:hypothetical protein